MLIKIPNQHLYMQIRQCFECQLHVGKCMSMNENEEMITDNADASYPDADPGATSFEYSWFCLN